MKYNFLTFFVISLFAVSMVFAPGENTGSQSDTGGQPETTNQPVDSGNPAETGNGTQVTQNIQNQGENSQIQTQTQTSNPGMGEQVRTQVQSGNYATQDGKQVQVQTQDNNQIQLKSGAATAQTSMKMTQEQTATGTKLQVELSNGKNAEVKIMPDTASEKAMEQLRLKTCTAESGCSIELKEVGSREQIKAAYEIKTQANAKFLGLFKTKVQVQAQVDAGTGEVIKTSKPWWAKITTE